MGSGLTRPDSTEHRGGTEFGLRDGQNGAGAVFGGENGRAGRAGQVRFRTDRAATTRGWSSRRVSWGSASVGHHRTSCDSSLTT